MKLLDRITTPIKYVVEGDSIQLSYDNKIILQRPIEKPMTLTEALIFEVEEGDIADNVKCGIGGAFLEMKNEE